MVACNGETAQYDMVEVAEVLVRLGAKMDLPSPRDGHTLLCQAVCSGSAEGLAFFFEELRLQGRFESALKAPCSNGSLKSLASHTFSFVKPHMLELLLMEGVDFRHELCRHYPDPKYLPGSPFYQIHVPPPTMPQSIEKLAP